MKKYVFLLLLLLVSTGLKAQTIFWQEDFNNGCTDNCNASTYMGSNGAWSVVDVTAPGAFANQWFVSCSENGEALGACGAGCGNNATLHVGSVPCSLCLMCPTGDCGASYNAGPSSLSGEDPTTNKRAISPLISTIGKTSISINFKYIERGQGTIDDCLVEFSTDGGVSWFGLVNTPKTPTSCGAQGQWTSLNAILPSICENIPNFRLAFHWINNDDGTGTDPSFAVDDLQLSVPSTTGPLANFTIGSSSQGCDTTCVSVTDASTGSPTQWSWQCPGAVNPSQSGSTPAPFCFTSSGVFPLTLIVSNGTDHDTISKNLTVNLLSRPQVNISCTDSSLCPGDCINFLNPYATGASSSSWTFNGGTPSSSSSATPPPVCYTNPGNFSVTLTVSNGSCTASMTKSNYIIVNTPVVPTITANGVVLTSSNASTYQWYSVQAGLLSGQTQASYTATQTGDYYVITTDANGCTAQSASYPVTIAVLAANFSTSVSGTGCDTACVSASDLSTGTPLQWSWDCPGAINPVQTGQFPDDFCFTASGTYPLTLIVQDGSTSDTLTQTLSINLLTSPDVQFTSADIQLCRNECTDFQNLTGGTIVSASWTFTGGNPLTSTDLNPAQVCYPTGGLFPVTLTIDNGTCVRTRSIVNYMTVTDPIVPTITLNGTTLTSSPAIAYQWYSVQNGLLSGETSLSYEVLTNGDYYVVTTDIYGCTALSDTISVDLSGIHELHGGRIILYPNPVIDQALLHFENTPSKNTRIEIRDDLGRSVFSQDAVASGNNVVLSLESLAAGVYVLELSDYSGSCSFKLVKN